MARQTSTCGIKMNRSLWSFAIVAGTLGASAFASSTATATLGPLTVELIDLNMADGITPSITFPLYSPLPNTRAQALALQTINGASQFTEDVGANPWQGVMAVSNLLYSFAAASLLANTYPDATGAVLAARGDATSFISDDANELSRYYAEVQAPSSSPFTYFVLSPNTSVRFFGQGTVSVSVERFNAVNADIAESAVLLHAWGPGALGAGSQDEFDKLEASVTAPTGIRRLSKTESRVVSATFSNQTTSDMFGNLYSSAYVNGFGFSRPVPEPSVAFTLLLGLACLRFLFKR